MVIENSIQTFIVLSIDDWDDKEKLNHWRKEMIKKFGFINQIKGIKLSIYKGKYG